MISALGAGEKGRLEVKVKSEEVRCPLGGRMKRGMMGVSAKSIFPTKKAPSPRELAGDNRKKVPVVSVSADQRKAANRTYHGCKVCLKTEAEGALFSATNYCGRQRV